MTGFDLRLQRRVDAPPDTAFEHWFDAEARRGWYAPEAGWLVEAETDLRVGGAWSVRYGPTPDHMYAEYGVFEEIDPPSRVVYTNRHEYPDGRAEYATLVTVLFEAKDRGTLVTVIDTGYPTEEIRDANEQGWPAFLDAYERSAPGNDAGDGFGLRSCRVDASIAVSDMARARTFYEGQLGLSGAAGGDGSRRYHCGAGTELHVYPSAENARRTTGTLATWRVANIELVVDELQARGVRFERYADPSLAADDKGIHTMADGKVAWFRDLDGNTFAVEQSLNEGQRE